MNLFGGIHNFNGQGVQALVGELLQGIIHKPVFGHSAQALKNPSPNSHPKMRSLTRAVGARVASVGGAFINDLEFKRLQFVNETVLNLICCDVHGASVDSSWASGWAWRLR